MSVSIIDRASHAFAAENAGPPPLSLRGGTEVDGYSRPAPFDAVQDAVTDEYLEGYTFSGLPHLDSQSWRHYLPHLIAYAFRHPDDPRMVVEALIRSLRPPDRYPPRLGSLTSEQEAVIAAFLEQVALEPAWPHLQTEAQQALEEWWLPNPRSRPTTAEIARARATPVTCRTVGSGVYRLDVPDTLMGSGLRDIPEESRRVETWGGYLCGDAHTVIAVNVAPLPLRSLVDSLEFRRQLFRDDVVPRRVGVSGATEAQRMDGLTHGTSAAEPQALTVVLAATHRELVTLTIHTWPREDLAREAERIVRSFRLVGDH